MPIATETSAGGWSSCVCHTKMANKSFFRVHSLHFYMAFVIQMMKVPKTETESGILWGLIQTLITDSCVLIFELGASVPSTTGWVPNAQSKKSSSWDPEAPWLLDDNIISLEENVEQVAKWAFRIDGEIQMMLPQSWTWSSPCLRSDPRSCPDNIWPIWSSEHGGHAALIRSRDTKLFSLLIISCAMIIFA